LYIRTFGCQMNVRDSEIICGLLQKEGYQITQDPRRASIIIFNTCSVRQHAEDKVWSELGRLKKGQSPKNSSARDLSGTVPIIGVVGCMAQNYKEKIFERVLHVNFVVGPSDIYKIPSILKRLDIGHRPSLPVRQAGTIAVLNQKLSHRDCKKRCHSGQAEREPESIDWMPGPSGPKAR